jgi:hypothetical protein
MATINEVANELATRLTRIFLASEDNGGARPVFGHHPRMQRDPHFRDYVHFYEYFHGDTGRGVGASHQTGWTGLVAKLLLPRYSMEAAHIPDITQPLQQGIRDGHSRSLHAPAPSSHAPRPTAEAAARTESSGDGSELGHRPRHRLGAG